MKAGKTAKKSFDCVASKRRAQDRIYRKIRGKSAAAQIAYFDKAVQDGPLAEFWKKLVAGGRRARTSGRMSASIRRTA